MGATPWPIVLQAKLEHMAMGLREHEGAQWPEAESPRSLRDARPSEEGRWVEWIPTLCYLLRGRCAAGKVPASLYASSTRDTRWSTSLTPMRHRCRDPGLSQDGEANGSPWLQMQQAGDLRRKQKRSLDCSS